MKAGEGDAATGRGEEARDGVGGDGGVDAMDVEGADGRDRPSASSSSHAAVASSSASASAASASASASAPETASSSQSSSSSSSRSSRSNRQILGGEYVLRRKIGSGSFGKVYLGYEAYSGKRVAIKVEKRSTRHPQLYYESKVYKLLRGGQGIPSVYRFAKEGQYNILVMQHLGPNLEDLFNYCGRRFTLKTVLLIAEELISRIEFIHSRGFVHRDIKPANFVIGHGNVVYAIDFGLAKRYRHPDTNKHVSFRKRRHLTGTPRYASINNHVGCEQSRRDDLESIGHVLIYFLLGRLPWQGFRAKTKEERYQMILEKKQHTPLLALCNGLPEEFSMFLRHCRLLDFEQQPDYTYLKAIFRDVMRRKGWRYDRVFDWVARKQRATQAEIAAAEKDAELQMQRIAESERSMEALAGGGSGASGGATNGASGGGSAADAAPPLPAAAVAEQQEVSLAADQVSSQEQPQLPTGGGDGGSGSGAMEGVTP